MTSSEILAAIYAADSASVDEITFDLLVDLLHEERFSTMEEILATVDLELFDSTAVFTFVCVSNWARDRLPNRDVFCDRAETRLITLCGKEHAAELMREMRGEKLDPGLKWALDVLSPWMGKIS